jgi:hypothetical protein
VQFYCPPPTDKYFTFCLYCPIPPADKYLYFPVSLCNSTAPSFLLKGTSPFACVFKPWAWLIHFGVLIQLQNGFRVVIRTRPLSLSTPHLVIRRRSPRDPRITGPAGRVIEAPLPPPPLHFPSHQEMKMSCTGVTPLCTRKGRVAKLQTPVNRDILT